MKKSHLVAITVFLLIILSVVIVQLSHQKDMQSQECINELERFDNFIINSESQEEYIKTPGNINLIATLSNIGEPENYIGTRSGVVDYTRILEFKGLNKKFTTMAHFEDDSTLNAIGAGESDKLEEGKTYSFSFLDAPATKVDLGTHKLYNCLE